MKLSLFDLHCDTAGEMLRQSQELGHNTLAVSLERASCYEQYVQVMAFWTDRNQSEQSAWAQLLAMYHRLKEDEAVQSGRATVCHCIPCSLSHTPQLLLAVEDARVLCGRLERVDTLYEMGVRILTPLWAGISSIGGAHGTDEGLTPFGRAAVSRAISLGMVADLSHASERSAEEMLAIAHEMKRPVIASHSNLYDVMPVSRNLKAAQVRAICASGGLIGLNLHVPFLTSHTEATEQDVYRHVEGFLELGAAHALALGCDMDGARLPYRLSTVDALPRLAEEMLRHNLSESLVHAVFFDNARRFAERFIS